MKDNFIFLHVTVAASLAKIIPMKDVLSQNVQLLEMGHRNDVIVFSILGTLLIA